MVRLGHRGLQVRLARLVLLDLRGRLVLLDRLVGVRLLVHQIRLGWLQVNLKSN